MSCQFYLLHIAFLCPLQPLFHCLSSATSRLLQQPVNWFLYLKGRINPPSTSEWPITLISRGHTEVVPRLKSLRTSHWLESLSLGTLHLYIYSIYSFHIYRCVRWEQVLQMEPNYLNRLSFLLASIPLPWEPTKFLINIQGLAPLGDSIVVKSPGPRVKLPDSESSSYWLYDLGQVNLSDPQLFLRKQE